MTADDILILDPDREHAAALGTYLERRQQLEVYIADDVEHFLLLLDNIAPRILLVEFRFPGHDLTETLKQIRLASPLRQILITVEPDDLEHAVHILQETAAYYLTKPVKSGLLDHALHQARERIAAALTLRQNKRRLETMLASQDLQRQLFEEVPCYISVQDRQFRLTATNRLFKKDFGSAIGTHCYRVYKQRDTPCDKCPVAETFADGKPHQTEEIVTSKDGNQYNVLTFTAPIRDSDGTINQVMEMSTNITQIRQLQDHLVSLGLMLGSMSHGVKGMLTAMDGGIYQLETGIAGGDVERIGKAFGQVKQMSGRIRKMVLEILYYAKSRELRYQRLPVKELYDTVITAARPIAQKNDIALTTDIPDDIGEIEVDPNWVESALVNLMENAVDACTYDHDREQHLVQFSVEEKGPDRICFTIRDNGMGMDAETRNKMFTLFFTSKGSQGTGLGLFIANRVIRQHGGKIVVESEPQQGTCFWICLPRTRPEDLRLVDFPETANNRLK